MSDIVEVAGFPLALERAYDPDTHLWLAEADDGRVRIGLDALGVEADGTLAQLDFVPVGEVVRRGGPFGSLEAAKFVGPLGSPLSGVVVAHNDAVLADPSLVEQDPYGSGWLIELLPRDRSELSAMISGSEPVLAWFSAEIEAYRLKGVLAE